MGCNCHTSRKQNKEVITELAIRYAKTMEVDVQLYTWTQRGVGRLYDFEIANSQDRGIGLLRIINFRDYKSEDVLSDTVEPKQDSGRSEKPDGSKRRGKSKKDNVGLGIDNEPAGEIEQGESKTEVAGNS